ncbi:MAG: hypothetical protein Q8K60_08040 [Parachlamydiaceae bacterium]|nr:hypothetical protein [Parachlamydiaceae bacterium]
MNLKFLENKVNFTELKNVFYTFNQKVQQHEYFVFGAITAANAVTIPLANFLSNLISSLYSKELIQKDQTGNNLIFNGKSIILTKETVYSKLINFTLFGGTLFIVNKYVISKLLNQSHTKWVFLGTLALSYLRYQQQILENSISNFKNESNISFSKIETFENRIIGCHNRINDNWNSNVDSINSIKKEMTDFKLSTENLVINKTNEIKNEINPQLEIFSKLLSDLKDEKIKLYKKYKTLEKILNTIKTESISREELGNFKEEFKEILEKIAQFETKLNSIEKIQKNSPLTDKHQTKNNNNNNNNIFDKKTKKKK